MEGCLLGAETAAEDILTEWDSGTAKYMFNTTIVSFDYSYMMKPNVRRDEADC